MVRNKWNPPPKRISATLPMVCEYRIWMVEQFKSGHSDKFLGHYCLTLQSSQDAWQTFEPLNPQLG
jgi:hypothetical protein